MSDQDAYRLKPRRAGLYDYHREGAYFVTTVIHHRAHLLGRVEGGAVMLSDAGTMIDRYWFELGNKFPDVLLDEYVIMPNHIHGIITVRPTSTDEGSPHSLGDIMRWFKTQTTNAYIRGVKQSAWPRFDGHLWQPQYWDHIVRNDVDLERVREYVFNNPGAWDEDPDNADSDDAWQHQLVR